MKKSVMILSAFLMGLCGCSGSTGSSAQVSSAPGQEAAENTEQVTEENTEQTETAAEGEKGTLLVYFSRAGENWEVGVVEKGNTCIAAEYIAEAAGADVFEIIPSEPYPSDYMETVAIAEEEKNNNARPEIQNVPENWDSYDTIILGYPIWHGDLPMIVYTFLENYDFAGKTVYPFNTHGGSGLAGTPDKIRSTIPSADVREGLALSGKTVQNDFTQVQADIDAWLQDSGLVK